MSEAQDEARRMNALKSTGPRSEEGKAVSKMNAMKHGFRSQMSTELPVDIEEDEGYQTLMEEMVACYEPETPVEEILVNRIAVLNWRLQRVQLAEKKTLQSAPGTTYTLPPAGALERILKYERTMDRQLLRTIAMLEKIKSNRIKNQKTSGNVRC